MATVNTNDTKYSFKYTVSQPGESQSRTISGLNIWNAGDNTSGTNTNVAVTMLYDTLHSFSNGTISNVRFILERMVNI